MNTFDEIKTFQLNALIHRILAPGILEVLLLSHLLGDFLAYLLSGNQTGYDEKNSYQIYVHFHHIPKLDTSCHKMLTKWFCLANLPHIPS